MGMGGTEVRKVNMEAQKGGREKVDGGRDEER